VSRIKTRVGKAKTKLAIVAKLQIGPDWCIINPARAPVWRCGGV